MSYITFSGMVSGWLWDSQPEDLDVISEIATISPEIMILYCRGTHLQNMDFLGW